MDTNCKPIWQWVVRFEWHRSMRFDNPWWYWFNDVRCFNTSAEADEFARADHPEFPGFRVKAVYAEAIPRLKNALASAGEAYYGQCTDEQLVTL